MKFFPLDSWSPTHVFGSFFLTVLLAKFMMPVGAAGIGFLLGCLWEVIDELVHLRYDWFVARHLPVDRFWDRRGGDWSDILADLVGCLLGLGLLVI